MPRELIEIRAISLRVLLRRLATYHRNVVIKAEMPGPVIVLQQHALRGQRLPQIRVVVQTGERRVKGLVLQDDQPHMLDLPRPDPQAEPPTREPLRLAPAAGRGTGRDDRHHGRRHRRRDGHGAQNPSAPNRCQRARRDCAATPLACKTGHRIQSHRRTFLSSPSSGHGIVILRVKHASHVLL